MLLVLIDLGDGVVRSCFDRVEPGLAGQIRTEVAHYVAEAYARAAEPFIAFRWRERNDVRRAQRLAAEAESPIVTSGLLFAGVLDTESSTQKQLRARLGTEAFERLRAAALAAHTIAAPGPTPGAIIGDVA